MSISEEDHTNNIETGNLSNAFSMRNAMDYSVFTPRLYNFCKSLGFQRQSISPLVAFCSDEDQAYHLLYITKHFGIFPIDIGSASGEALLGDSKSPAYHGKDILFIQAPHVSYESLISENYEDNPVCYYHDKLLEWYIKEHQYAQNNIRLQNCNGQYLLLIDNQLLDEGRDDGLLLNMGELVEHDEEGRYRIVNHYSTAKSYIVTDGFRRRIDNHEWQEGDGGKIGNHLHHDLFYFKRKSADTSNHSLTHINELNAYMPRVVTASNPSFTIALVNCMINFEHTYRVIVKNQKFHRQNLLYIAGIHVDTHTINGRAFYPTMFIPWAAYVQQCGGTHYILEQDMLLERLLQCPAHNPDEIDLEDVLREMEQSPTLHVVNSGISKN